MRRTLTLCRTALVGAAAAVLLTACGGGGDDNSASSSSSSTTTSSSSSSSSAAAADTEFCQRAGEVLTQLNSASNVQDPNQVAPLLQQIATQLDALEPPQEIASDWDTLVAGIKQLAQAAAATDFNDPQQAATFTQKLSELGTQLQTPSTNVENYLKNQCGIDTGDTGSASPTS